MNCFYSFCYFLIDLAKMISMMSCSVTLTILLLSTTCPVLAKSVDPDQLASEEAN